VPRIPKDTLPARCSIPRCGAMLRCRTAPPLVREERCFPAAAESIATTEATAHADRRVAVVFLADDAPTARDASIPPMAATIAAAHAYAPPVTTFAVAIFAAPDAGSAADFQALATAGGTDASVPTPPLAVNLVAARDSVACDVVVAGGSAVPAGATITLTTGAPRVLAQVAGAAACGASERLAQRRRSHDALPDIVSRAPRERVGEGQRRRRVQISATPIR